MLHSYFELIYISVRTLTQMKLVNEVFSFKTVWKVDSLPMCVWVYMCVRIYVFIYLSLAGTSPFPFLKYGVYLCYWRLSNSTNESQRWWQSLTFYSLLKNSRFGAVFQWADFEIFKFEQNETLIRGLLSVFFLTCPDSSQWLGNLVVAKRLISH